MSLGESNGNRWFFFSTLSFKDSKDLQWSLERKDGWGVYLYGHKMGKYNTDGDGKLIRERHS